MKALARHFIHLFHASLLLLSGDVGIMDMKMSDTWPGPPRDDGGS